MDSVTLTKSLPSKTNSEHTIFFFWTYNFLLCFLDRVLDYFYIVMVMIVIIMLKLPFNFQYKGYTIISSLISLFSDTLYLVLWFLAMFLWLHKVVSKFLIVKPRYQKHAVKTKLILKYITKIIWVCKILQGMRNLTCSSPN